MAIVHVMYVLMFVLHAYFLSCVYLLLVCYAHDFPWAVSVGLLTHKKLCIGPRDLQTGFVCDL